MRQTLSILLCLSLVAAAGSPCYAAPDQVTVQSALVWRTDGTGDYLLPEIKPDTTHESSIAVSTSGQIESMTAAIDFDGQVNLELSADGGLHYTPAIHGVPLTTGFARGNRVKWRAKVGPEGALREVKITYMDGSRVAGAFGEPRLSGYRYRKPIIILGSDEPVYHYQVALAIGESDETAAYDLHCEQRVRGDFADLRITGPDGLTILPHYLENIVGAAPARLAIVWIKIPYLPPQGLTLYLYYGNPTAPSISDGKAVFDFFDAFDGSALDAKAWDHQAGQGSVRVADSMLHLTGGSVMAKTFQFADGIVEYVATTAGAQDDARLIIRSDPEATHPDETNQVAYASAYAGAEHVLASGSVVQANDPKPIMAETPYGYQVVTQDTQLMFQRFDAEFASVEATIMFDDVGGLTRGLIGLHSEGSASYDWVRVRKLALPPPAVSEATAAAPEETANLPLFTNTTVLPNGDLALLDPKVEGAYTTLAMASDFAIRILVPNWDGAGVESVAVSADGAKTFRLNCHPGEHYYASKAHFMPGTSLVAKIGLEASQDVPAPAVKSVSLEYTAGNLFIVSPNGGEELAAGTSQQIVWSAIGHDAKYPVKLSYSLDGGRTYKPITDSTDNDGTYVWVLPDSLNSDEVLVKIADKNDAAIFDASDDPFAILPADLLKQRRAEEVAEEEQPEAEYTDDLLTLLDKLTQDPNATPHDIVVKVNESGGYKAGDIVMIRPAGTEWSEAEKNSFLIIQADLSPEAIKMLMSADATGNQRKFKIDLSYFDLRSRASDKGKPPVRRHYKAKEDLRQLLEDRTDAMTQPLTPNVTQ